jgi:hypothetical protein
MAAEPDAGESGLAIEDFRVERCGRAFLFL